MTYEELQLIDTIKSTLESRGISYYSVLAHIGKGTVESIHCTLDTRKLGSVNMADHLMRQVRELLTPLCNGLPVEVIATGHPLS